MVRRTKTKTATAGNGVALAFGLLLALVIGETILRLWAPQMTGPIQFAFDRELGAVPVPGQSARRTLPGVYSYSYTNDSQGLRIVPRVGGGANRGPRVLLLGDSFTYGIGVDDADTYAAQLQEALPQVTVVNAGIGGKGTDYALRFVQTRATRVHPRVSVLAFCRNDFCDNGRGDYFTLGPDRQLLPKSLRDEAAKTFVARIPGYTWVISRSHLANLLKQTVIQGPRWLGEPSTGSLPDCVDVAGDVTYLYLHQLRDETRRIGSALVAFYIPTEDEVEAKRGSREEATFLRFCTALQIEGFSMRDCLESAPLPARALYLAEGHWTPAGHRVVARALATQLRSPLQDPRLRR